MSSWFSKAFNRREKELLTPEMCAEIDRLGLERSSIQWIVDEEGLEFGRFYLSQRTRAASLFDKWYPRLVAFAATKRSQAAMSDPPGPFDVAIRRILEPKIRDAERVPSRGNFTATFFTAPRHVLPFVSTQWPSTYRHPVYITPDELTEWRQIYAAEEKDQDTWWFAFQDWDAQSNPPFDSWGLPESTLRRAEGHTPVLIVYGLCWGSLAGGSRIELWSIDPSGNETFVQDVADVTY